MTTTKQIKVEHDKRAIIAAGFNYAGTTTDKTMLTEIARDFAAAGYKTRFLAVPGFKVSFWTKRKQVEQPEAWLHGWKA